MYKKTILTTICISTLILSGCRGGSTTDETDNDSGSIVNNEPIVVSSGSFDILDNLTGNSDTDTGSMPDIQATRKSDEGCNRQKIEGNGLSFLAQNCNIGERSMLVTGATNDTRIIQLDGSPIDPNAIDPVDIIAKIYTIPSGQTIGKYMLSMIDPSQCNLKINTDISISDYKLYQIVPKTPDADCKELGGTDRYIIVNERNLSKFGLVVVDEDKLIDLSSIRLL